MSTNDFTFHGGDAGVFHRAEGLTLYLGDALPVLRNLRSGSVDCVVTSPPTRGMRAGTPTGWTGGRLGCPHLAGVPATSLEGVRRCVRCGATRSDRQHGPTTTPARSITALRRVFAQLCRVLVPSGTVWLHLADDYATNTSLLGMPWRIALALQADGWILRNAIIWHKPNTTRLPTPDRLASRYELVFLLVRQPHYFFDLNPIRQLYTGDRPLSRRAHRRGTKPHTATGLWPPPGIPETHLGGRNPGDVWTIPTPPHHAAHLSLELAIRCIAAGCPPGGTVLDPFSRTGTTGLAARRLGCRYIGIDTNPEHHTTALHRLGLIPATDDPPTPGQERP